MTPNTVAAAAPPNDDIENAVPIIEGVDVRFSTVDATTQPTEDVCGDGTTVWYTFTAPEAGDYVAFNAYLPMNEAMESRLQRLRSRVRDGHQVATTVGFGPRFLHSTGQLHKGGANNGVFVQITAEDPEDLAVPGQNYGFSLLKRAQEAGDFMALSSRERRLVRIHLDDAEAGLDALIAAIGA